MKSTSISLILMFWMTLASPSTAEHNQDPVYEAGNGVTVPKVTKTRKAVAVRIAVGIHFTLK